MKLARLREWREAKGMMQRELAEAAETSDFTVRRAESGGGLRVNTAKKFADALGVEIVDLMEMPPVPAPLTETPPEMGLAQPDPSRPHTLEELLEQAGIPGPYWLTQPTEEFESFWRGVSFEEARDRYWQIRREYQALEEELKNQVHGEPSGAPELQERMVSIVTAAFGRHLYALAAAPGKGESKGEFHAREQRGDTRAFLEVVPGVPGAGDAIEDIVG